MEVYPLAWLFFIPFIVATSFTVLNLFIGVIVAAMEAEHERRNRPSARNCRTTRRRSCARSGR